MRRMKVYEAQAAGDPVRVVGLLPDGSPACATARLHGG